MTLLKCVILVTITLMIRTRNYAAMLRQILELDLLVPWREVKKDHCTFDTALPWRNIIKEIAARFNFCSSSKSDLRIMLRLHLTARFFSRSSFLFTEAKKGAAVAGSAPFKRFVFTQKPPLDEKKVAEKETELQNATRHPLHIIDRQSYLISQPAYTFEELNSVKNVHVKPPGLSDKVAYYAMKVMRITFDFVTGYSRRKFKQEDYLNRILFLETVAGVPGIVGGMHRHMKSLRTMKRDRGWVHTLLEECENERMHLLTFLKLKQPSAMFRFFVLMGQGVFFNLYFLFYWVSPKYCHRFVGYLEEEAVLTYTHILEEIDNGVLHEWKSQPAPDIAKDYWRLGPNGTVRDLILAVRADEANHRDVNHKLSDIRQEDPNPFIPPKVK